MPLTLKDVYDLFKKLTGEEFYPDPKRLAYPVVRQATDMVEEIICAQREASQDPSLANDLVDEAKLLPEAKMLAYLFGQWAAEKIRDKG